MWNMGGYGFYVWSSFGIVAIALSWLMLSSLKHAKRVRKHLQKMKNN